MREYRRFTTPAPAPARIGKAEDPSPVLKAICKQLGPEYSIGVIDRGDIIYRRIGDAYDIEISMIGRYRKMAALYLWDHRNGLQITARLYDVPRERIAEKVEELIQRNIGA